VNIPVLLQRRRVEYTVACLLHQSLSGLAPVYLADDINLVAAPSPMSSRQDIRRPTYTHNTFGDMNFAPIFNEIFNKKLSYCRDSARLRSLHSSRSFKVIDFGRLPIKLGHTVLFLVYDHTSSVGVRAVERGCKN